MQTAETETNSDRQSSAPRPSTFWLLRLVARGGVAAGVVMLLFGANCNHSSSSPPPGSGGTAGHATGSGGSGRGGAGGATCSNGVEGYVKPGCGEDAAQVCISGPGGACASPVCGCDGVVWSDGCYSTHPFGRFLRPGDFTTIGSTCDPNAVAGGGAGGHTNGGSGGGGTAGHGGAGGATGGTGGAGGAGGATCSNGVEAYVSPGCGGDVGPVCISGNGGACASPVCGCDGVVSSDGCRYSTHPFAYFVALGDFSSVCDPHAAPGGAGGGGAGGGGGGPGGGGSGD